jgi:hypothetical protein
VHGWARIAPRLQSSLLHGVVLKSPTERPCDNFDKIRVGRFESFVVKKGDPVLWGALGPSDW